MIVRDDANGAPVPGEGDPVVPGDTTLHNDHTVDDHA